MTKAKNTPEAISDDDLDGVQGAGSQRVTQKGIVLSSESEDPTFRKGVVLSSESQEPTKGIIMSSETEDPTFKKR